MLTAFFIERFPEALAGAIVVREGSSGACAGAQGVRERLEVPDLKNGATEPTGLNGED
jgi:hypothetical protein